MEKSVKTIIHVNQAVIRTNNKKKLQEPVLTVKQGKQNTYAMEAEVLGPSKIVYSPDKPLSCGAKVWIETTSEVILHGEKEWSEVKEVICK